MDDVSFNNAHRSGRTSRMIEKALDLQKEGKAIYILCAPETIQTTKYLANRMCEQKGVEFPNDIKFETIHSLGEENIDWQNKSLIKAHPNCVLLIDHHVWMQKFYWVLEGFHEYDQAQE